jgi:hypothetical protein
MEELAKANPGMSKEQIDHQMALAAEQDITDTLFADMDADASSKVLSNHKEYVNLGKKVGETIYAGKLPYKLPVFFAEVFRDMKMHLDSEKIKEILDQMTTIYNNKVKEEK